MRATTRNRRPERRRRWIRLAALVPAVIYAMFISTPVAHACAPLDLECVADSLVDTQDSDSGLPDPDGVSSLVDDTIDDVQDTVGGAVDDVGKTVDEILNPGDDPGGGGGGGGGGNGNGGAGGGGPGAGKNPVSPIGGIGEPGPAGLVPLPANDVLDSAPVAATEPPGFIRRFGEGAVQAVKQLGFPFLLTLMVVAFLLIQNRLDRKDPRLALAPVTPEVARFV